MNISTIFLILVCFRLKNCLNLSNCLNLPSCLNLSADNVNCILYRTITDYRFIKASNSEQILEQDIFNLSLKTIFYIPGERTPIDSPFIRPVLESYIRSKHYNVIQLSGYYYTSSTEATGLFGEVMNWLGELYGSVISKLIRIGLPLKTIELVGHSYGANMAIITANYSFPKLPLLIGLDPPPWVRFKKGYTNYTIALHTNLGMSGSRYYNHSDSDLIANNGMIQPKCSDRNLFEIQSEDDRFEIIRCSHISANNYWGSMIENPQLFYGVECSETDCNYNNIQMLGPNLRSPGIFYFKTSKYSPFGLGMEGIKNVTPIDINLLNVYSIYKFQIPATIKDYLKYILDQYNYIYGHKIKIGNETLFYS